MDVFRIFDAMNDVRNFEKAVKATIDVGAHAQGTLSYTTSPGSQRLILGLILAKRWKIWVVILCVSKICLAY